MVSRERFAWVWLVALVAVFGTYFAAVSVYPGYSELSMLGRIAVLGVALGGLGLIAAVQYGLDWICRRGQVPEPVDERDRLVEWRASAVAYYVLIGGMILVGVVMPFQASGWELVHAALLAIAVAEVVHTGLIVHGYRRGWRD